jgi:hypothetical protein
MRTPSLLVKRLILPLVLTCGVTGLALKALILSRRWGSVPAPDLISVSIGGHDYLAARWAGIGYIVSNVVIVACGAVGLLIVLLKKK